MNNVIPLFKGFEEPKENWCKLPLAIIDNMPLFSSMAEMCVVLYILRHTWGYQEFTEHKVITVDEFVNGRKRKDGSRIDNGTGMTEPSVRSGLKNAEAHGFITIDTDDRDKARVKKGYKLAMTIPNQGEKNLPPGGKEFTIGVETSLPRSEKDTLERNSRKSSAQSAYPSTLKRWKENHISRYFNEFRDAIESLRLAWGLNVGVIEWDNMTRNEQLEFIEVHMALKKSSVWIEDYPKLIGYSKQKCSWMKSGMRLKQVLDYITDWRNSLVANPQSMSNGASKTGVWSQTDVPELPQPNLTAEERARLVEEISGRRVG